MLEAAYKIAQWRKDPVRFVHELFGVTPDPWQAEALRAYAQPGRKRISRQACAGPGKSAELAWEGWHFLTCFGDAQDRPKGLAVSINRDNLRDGLWAEFGKWHNRAPLLKDQFIWTAERIAHKDFPQDWFISARSWPKTADPEEQGKTLSGIHSRYIWFGVDEAGAIPIQVKQAAEQALAQGDLVFGCISVAGNPISRDGILYAAATRERANWHVITITGDPDDPNRSSRIDIEHARAMIREYGRDDPWVKAYILGQFPDSAIDTLLSVEDVERAMKRSVRIEDVEWAGKVIGCDVARQGLDVTAIYQRQHNLVPPPLRVRSQDGHQIAGHLAHMWREWDADACFVDDTGGYGGSVIDQLRHLGFSPIGVQYASRPNDPRFADKRTENWWNMAQAIKEGVALPDVPELRGDLVTPTISWIGDKLKLEDKAQIRKRLKRSTDDGDALSQTWHQPVVSKHSPGAMHKHVGAQKGYRARMDDAWSDVMG